MRMIVSVLAMLALLLGPALAAPSELDGTWVGKTPRGSSIRVVVADGKTTHYFFQGRSQGVVGGAVKGKSATFGLRTNKSSKIVLQKQKGDKVQLVYTDNTGPDALKVILTKK